jgi:hypothetical protein
MKTMLSVIMLLGILLASLYVGCSGPGAQSGEGTLRVRVVNEANEPLSGAKVISNIQPEGQLKVTGSTDGDGYVTYTRIKGGRYEFYVSRFDHEQKDFSVAVVAGRMTELTVTLAAEGGSAPR